MILKEAFRYQNYLNDLLARSIMYVSNDNYMTNIKTIHKKSKINKDDIDETIIEEKPYSVSFSPNQLIDFIVNIISEKEKLSKAISVAKAQSSIDMDSAASLNKLKQTVIKCLQNLNSLHNYEKDSTCTGYKFNNDGDQVPYIYPTTKIVTIDFDRNSVKGLIKKYKKESDDTSIVLDKAMLNIEVYYDPIWDVDTPLEEAVLL